MVVLNGNAGFGISSPQATLDVIASTAQSPNGQLRIAYPGGTGFNMIQSSANGDISLNNAANSNLILATNNLNRVYVSPAGNVGINTLGVAGTPITTLQVVGGVYASTITATSTMTVQGNAFSVGISTFSVNGGFVGIGTASPAYPLQVVGNSVLGTVGGTRTTIPQLMISAPNALSQAALGLYQGNNNAFGYEFAVSQVNDGELNLSALASNTTTFLMSWDRADFKVRIGTMSISGTNAPPNAQALCLSSGQLGHCTSVVGISGGCTCVAP